jgi:hypothetical protein
MDICASVLRGTVLIRDCLEAEAGFLLVQLIKTALTGPETAQHRRVVLLAGAQAASHHAAVLRRAGLQLPALAAAGRLAIVDLLPACSGEALPSLRDVHSMVASAATAGSAGSGVCLVVDDLAVSAVPAAASGSCLRCARGAPHYPYQQHTSDGACVTETLCRCCTAWQRAPLTGRPSCRHAWLRGRWGSAALPSFPDPRPRPHLPPPALRC